MTLAMKCKTVSKVVGKVAKNTKAELKEASKMASKKKKDEKEEKEEDVEEEEEEEEASKMEVEQKASKKASKMEVEEEEEEDEDDEDDEEDEEEDEEEQLSEEDKWKQQEKETLAARKQELKSTPADELKQLVLSKGLEKGNKADMIEALAAFEAKGRAEVHAHEAKLRSVVVKKKEEFEAQSLPQLRELCATEGITGSMTKEERITQLLTHWQKNDGVDKALAKMAVDKREAELVAKDSATLRKLCEKKRIDPFVKEVLVGRIVKRETEMGCFSDPKLKLEKNEEEAPAAPTKTDMVDALLAQDAARKKAIELKKQQEDAAASKRKELKAMSVEELKKALVKKGTVESKAATGKKEEMVEALFAAIEQEERIAARRVELKALGIDGLKKLLMSKKLETGKIPAMIETLIAHEAKIAQECRVYELKVVEVAAKKQEELDARTASDLKDLCSEKGLQVGGSKDERIERLVQEARRDGEIGRMIAVIARDERKVALFAMDTPSLVKLCVEVGVDPLVKEIMVERILDHESENAAVQEDKSTEPAAKKAKTSKK